MWIEGWRGSSRVSLWPLNTGLWQQECLKSRTLSVSVLSDVYKSNGIRPQGCLPREVFKRIQRWKKVSRQPIMTTFHAGISKFGKDGTSVKGKQQRDIQHLQYKKTVLSELALSNCPGSGPYRWQLYRWIDESLSDQTQFILDKKVTSAGFTFFCIGTQHLLTNDVPVCLVYCSGTLPSHTPWIFPTDIVLFYNTMLPWLGCPIPWVLHHCIILLS